MSDWGKGPSIHWRERGNTVRGTGESPADRETPRGKEDRDTSSNKDGSERDGRGKERRLREGQRKVQQTERLREGRRTEMKAPTRMDPRGTVEGKREDCKRDRGKSSRKKGL